MDTTARIVGAAVVLVCGSALTWMCLTAAIWSGQQPWTGPAPYVAFLAMVGIGGAIATFAAALLTIGLTITVLSDQ